MSHLQIVVGGQFGSEGKGHVAAQLARKLEYPMLVRTGGPNAGHTVIADQAYKLRQLPTGLVTNPGATAIISAGSLIDPDVLAAEIAQVRPVGPVLVDWSATIIEPGHKEAERLDTHLRGWSTCKGIGAARAGRVMRTAQTALQADLGAMDGVRLADSVELLTHHMNQDLPVLIEAAQGYGLGLHSEYYPKTTSADCRAIDALADVGISPWCHWTRGYPKVWVVVRPYPIRVAGDSGALNGETTWRALGLPEERTTVTNKVRRVGTFDESLVARALRANGAPSPSVVVALTMMDQILPALRGMQVLDHLAQLDKTDTYRLDMWIDTIHRLGARVEAIGTGPDTMVFLPPGGLTLGQMPDAAPVDSAVHRDGE